MKFIFFLIFTIFNFALIEFFSFVGSKMNLFVINETPFIYGKKPNQILSNYWIEKDIWGAWHEKNFKVSHKKKCFDVIYETNEIGARDKSFKNLKAINNIILLGDSFAEGYGIDKKNTFEKIIEKNLSVRQTENFVKIFKKKKNSLGKSSKDSNILSLESDVRDKIGMNVHINNRKNNSGSVSFDYKDLDQLNRLIEVIKQNY